MTEKIKKPKYNAGDRVGINNLHGYVLNNENGEYEVALQNNNDNGSWMICCLDSESALCRSWVTFENLRARDKFVPGDVVDAIIDYQRDTRSKFVVLEKCRYGTYLVASCHQLLVDSRRVYRYDDCDLFPVIEQANQTLKEESPKEQEKDLQKDIQIGEKGDIGPITCDVKVNGEKGDIGPIVCDVKVHEAHPSVVVSDLPIWSEKSQNTKDKESEKKVEFSNGNLTVRVTVDVQVIRK